MNWSSVTYLSFLTPDKNTTAMYGIKWGGLELPHFMAVTEKWAYYRSKRK
jgi:hypothetical protein